ncbi:MAG: GNAT family N-acetyltransferase [Rhodothermales bacterium]|nr:GNAT family N-acetyltransferase [Rhodothermales bacterium]
MNDQQKASAQSKKTQSIAEIRKIESGADFSAVEELQKEVWGLPDLDVVPEAQLIASVAAGGVLLGAFLDDFMAGFVFGFVGYENGHVVHHSHMLAIKPAYRKHNLGQRLKLAQRETVLQQGIDTMTWTFDPLQSQNAHINFSKLGVVSDRYLVNFYGEEATSFLLSNGTDRLWLTWLLDSKRVAERETGFRPDIDTRELEKLVAIGDEDLPILKQFDELGTAERFLIEIPSDINSLQETDFEKAVRWREATRSAFAKAIEAGCLVEEFCRSGVNGVENSRYVLNRAKGIKDID